MARAGREKKEAGSKGRCYLINGGDGLLVDRELARLAKSAAGGQGGECQTFWAPEKATKPPAQWSPEELERIGCALSTPSFFSASTMVVIRGAERLADEDLDQVTTVLERQEGATLVIVAAGGDMRRRLERRLGKTPLTVISAESPKRDKLFPEMRNLALELGHKIDDGACVLLQELVGNNLLELKWQLEKVSVAMQAGKTISEKDVALVVGHTRSHLVWEIVDAAADRKAKEALKLVAQLMDEGIQLPLLVGALASAFRRVWLAKEAVPGQGEKQPPSRYYDLKRARYFTAVELRHALRLLSEVDLNFKLGRGEPRWLLEHFVFEMCRLPLVA